jgi:NitT/TauT family transport system permease protein
MKHRTTIAALVTPNGAASAGSLKVLVAAQVALLVALWWGRPLSVLPGPAEVARALRRLWLEEGLGRELLESLALNLEALSLTLVLSLALSWATVLPAFRPVAGAVSKGRFLGLTGLTLVFMLAFGGGHRLKLWLLVFGMSVFFVTSMSAAVAAIPRETFDLARSLRMSEWRAAWEVVVKGTRDAALEALRQNAAIGWMMLTAVEGISRSEGGVGALLLNQNKHFHLAEVAAIQLTILAVGLAQDAALGALKRRLCPYAALRLERRS